jgi:surface antigen
LTAVSIEDETIAPEIAPESEDVHPRRADLADTSATSYTPRLSAPAKTNKYYYSNLNPFYQYGWGMPNCTCYAWGRAYEILGKAPNLSLYSAYLWYGYNKDNKIYSYGTKPKLGAIACWVYSSGTSGHVAVVEKIENNTITFSNSAYSGENFYTSTAPVKDPSNGNKYWIFQGYIYIGDFVAKSGTTTTTTTTTTAATSATNPTAAATEPTETTVTTSETQPTETKFLPGDVDGNNVVSVEDAQLALLAYVESMTGQSTGLTAQQELAADINGDKKVDIADVNIVINIMLGKAQASDYTGKADVTGDNHVDIADVNAIINIMLGKS